jgi:hypothetical protein
MVGSVRILGVHLVKADEPVHLIEILIEGGVSDFDFGDVTQKMANQPKSNWQVAYDEQLLETTSEFVCYAFFFHFLDFGQPLLTPAGALSLPSPTNVPEHLKSIHYEAP